MKTAFLTAQYEEPLADKTFKGLKLSIKEPGKKDKIINFNIGDPIVDFFDYKSWMLHNAEKEGIFIITYSSSVDHFYMDSEKYAERHVIFNKDYSEGELVHWTEAEKRGIDPDKLVTCCAHKDMKAWSELKQYVKSKTK